MSDVNPNEIQVEKDDRPASVERKRKQMQRTHPFNKKTIVSLLVIVILLLIGSMLIFREPANDTRSAAPVQTPYSAEDNRNAVTNDPNYQTVTAPEIARQPTETQVDKPAYRGRIEIPGEVTDRMAQEAANAQLPATPTTVTPAVTAPTMSAPVTSTPVVTTPAATSRANQPSQVPAKPATFNELPLTQNINPNYFVIQLSGGSSEKNLTDFARKQNLKNYLIIETKRNNKPWYILIKGHYPTKADANAAVKSLPSGLTHNKPWVRAGSAVIKEKQ